MKEYSILYFLAVANVLADFGLAEYSFEKKYVNEPVLTTHKDLSQVAMIEANEKGLSLCMAARKFVGVESEPMEKDFAPEFYYVQLISLGYRSVSVLKCPWKQILYVLPDRKSRDKYTIILATEHTSILAGKQMSDYLPKPAPSPSIPSTPFTVVVIESNLMTCREMLANEPRNFDLADAEFALLVKSECEDDWVKKKSALWKMKRAELEKLCSSAVDHIHGLNSGNLRPVLQKYMNEYERVQVVGLKGENSKIDKVGKRVALICPSVPRVYVLFENLRINKNMLALVVHK